MLRTFPGESMKGIRPVFISIETSAYSGATLLAFLLGAHPQITSVGEMSGLIPREDPEEYLCSCGMKIKVCDFWRSVEATMVQKGFDFKVAHFDTRFVLDGPKVVQYLRYGSFRMRVLNSMRDSVLYTWPIDKRQLRALIARNVAFIESVLETTGKTVFVDTSKDPLRLKSLHRLSNLDVRAIHLVRDVRGVVASRLRRGTAETACQAAHQWVKLHQRLETDLALLPREKRLRLRYEDFCQDATGNLERLYRFCGGDAGVAISDVRTNAHHIVGNPMRLNPLSEIKLDERWKSQLTEDQLQGIEQVAAKVGQQYGYF